MCAATWAAHQGFEALSGVAELRITTGAEVLDLPALGGDPLVERHPRLPLRKVTKGGSVSTGRTRTVRIHAAERETLSRSSFIVSAVTWRHRDKAAQKAAAMSSRQDGTRFRAALPPIAAGLITSPRGGTLIHCDLTHALAERPSQ
jgi:hypothetical protein